MVFMNQANSSIKFTHESSQEEVVFLDVVVYKETKQDDTTLHKRTHIKPTNKQLYIREDSYHPPGTGKGLAISEAIRYLCTNSEPEQFSKMMLQHKRNLTKRGYNSTKTTKWLKQIKFSTTTSRALKTENNKTEQTTDNCKPTFVTRYHPNARKHFT